MQHRPDDPPRPALSRKEHALLVEVVSTHAPRLVPLARDAFNVRWIEDHECEALSTVLSDVFLEHLDADDEPDAYGRQVDGLQGLIQQHRRGFWQDA